MKKIIGNNMKGTLRRMAYVLPILALCLTAVAAPTLVQGSARLADEVSAAKTLSASAASPLSGTTASPLGGATTVFAKAALPITAEANTAQAINRAFVPSPEGEAVEHDMLIANSSEGGIVGGIIGDIDGSIDGQGNILNSEQEGAAFSKGMENAIKKAKELFDIGDDYDFTGSIRSDNYSTIYVMEWNSASRSEHISVQIDENLNVLNYDKSMPSSGSYQPRLRISSDVDEALNHAHELSNAFLAKVLGATAKDYVISPPAQPRDRQREYVPVNYFRKMHGTPSYSDSVNIMVNVLAGEVTSFSHGGLRQASDYEDTNAMLLQDAQNAYMGKLGLHLVYKTKYDNDRNPVAFPAYEPVYGMSSFAIDAANGERVRLQQGGYYAMSKNAAVYGYEMAEEDSAGEARVMLSPQEEEAVIDMAGLITAGEAEQLVRQCTYLGLNDGYSLSSRSLDRGWPERNKQAWSLTFSADGDSDARTGQFDSVWVTIDARTKRIQSFSMNRGNYTGIAGGAGTKTLEDAKAAAEKMISDLMPDMSAGLKYKEDIYNPINPLERTVSPDSPQSAGGEGSDSPQSVDGLEVSSSPQGLAPIINLSYVRTVNGAEYQDNSVSIVYDAVNGRIIEMSSSWYDISFPSVSNAIGLEKAYEILFDRFGLTLVYEPVVDQQEASQGTVAMRAERAIYSGGAAGKIMKVYNIDRSKLSICVIDAFNGALLDNSGGAYRPEGAFEGYKDIGGHEHKEKFELLANHNILLPSASLRPEWSITQIDFLYLTSKLNSNTNYYRYPETENEIDGFYDHLGWYGIVTREQKQPNGVLTLMDAAVFIAKILDYAEIAEMGGALAVEYANAGDIPEEYLGYAQLMGALGIVPSGNGASFDFDKILTRGQTLEMIYGYAVK